MMYQREVISDAAIGVGIADRKEDLSVIAKPGCAAVIWRRQPPRNFQNWIDALEPDQLPETREIVRPGDIHGAALEACKAFDTPECKERDQLIDDVVSLADAFSTTMNAPYLRLRLDVVNSNAYRRFHIDAVTARLICTYRGTGTQYGISTDGAEPQRVFTVPTGAPILLRGTIWPEAPRAGLLHRSPPIEGTDETRLVLVLDPMDKAEENF